MAQKPLIPKEVMEDWVKQMEADGKMLPPDHPIYSEPPSITFGQRLRREGKPDDSESQEEKPQ